jgi:hypothetical protein
MAATPSEQPDRIVTAHKHCFANQEEVMASERCGCFYCLEIFSPVEINEWHKETNGKGTTAFCPFCFIDSVIGSKSGYPITPDFLAAMKSRWFDATPKAN